MWLRAVTEISEELHASIFGVKEGVPHTSFYGGQPKFNELGGTYTKVQGYSKWLSG